VGSIRRVMSGIFPAWFRMKPSIPSCMCVGVPKAGTTGLYHALQAHPEIWMPESKETQFFSSPDYHKGVEWYLKEFYSGADPGTTVGELSPKYLIHQDVPKRIRKTLGKHIRFLVILRNPVDRAWSHYCHSYERFRHFSFRPTEDLSFEEALKAEPERIAQGDEYSWTHGMWLAYYFTGLYARHLKNWFRIFSRENFLIITLEDLIDRPEETLDRITDHLRINRFDRYPAFKKSNTYSRPDLKESTRKMLLEMYKPHINELEG
jgi:hypothetical protein